MAHELDMSNDRANMAYKGQMPWHGLGAEIPEGANWDDWKTAAGMDWTAVKAPVRFKDFTGEERTYPDKYVLHRSDTQMPLSIVSEDYKVVQPWDLINFFKKLSEKLGGFELETAGCLQQGKKVWALAKKNEDFCLPGMDKVARYLTLATSYDFSLATVAVQTSVRIVCMNTMRAAMDGAHAMGNILRIIHRADDVLDRIRENMDMDTEWAQFSEVAFQLADRHVEDAAARRFFYDVLYPEQVRLDPKFSTNAAVRKTDRVMELYKNAPGQDLESADCTAWGMLNAITYWIDHESRARTNDNRLNRAWFGTGVDVKKRTMTRLQQVLAGELVL